LRPRTPLDCELRPRAISLTSRGLATSQPAVLQYAHRNHSCQPEQSHQHGATVRRCIIVCRLLVPCAPLISFETTLATVWYGIGASALNDNRLSGTIPTTIGLLKHLVNLYACNSALQRRRRGRVTQVCEHDAMHVAGIFSITNSTEPFRQALEESPLSNICTMPDE